MADSFDSPQICTHVVVTVRTTYENSHQIIPTNSRLEILEFLSLASVNVKTNGYDFTVNTNNKVNNVYSSENRVLMLFELATPTLRGITLMNSVYHYMGLLESSRNISANIKARYPVQFVTAKQLIPIKNGHSPFLIFRNIGSENGMINQQTRNINTFLKAVVGLDPDDISLILYEACNSIRHMTRDPASGRYVPFMVSVPVKMPDQAVRDMLKQKTTRESEIVILCYPATPQTILKVSTILKTLRLFESSSVACIKCRSFPMEIARSLGSASNDRACYMRNIHHTTQSVSGAIIRNIMNTVNSDTIFNVILRSINNLSTIVAAFRISRESSTFQTWAIINSSGALTETHFDVSSLLTIVSEVRIDSILHFSSLTRSTYAYANNPNEEAVDVMEYNILGKVRTYHQNTQKQSKALKSPSPSTTASVNTLSTQIKPMMSKLLDSAKQLKPPVSYPPINIPPPTIRSSPSVSTLTTTSSSQSDHLLEKRLDSMNNNIIEMFSRMQNQITQMQTVQAQYMNNVPAAPNYSLYPLTHQIAYSATPHSGLPYNLQTHQQYPQQQLHYQNQLIYGPPDLPPPPAVSDNV
jgi:hypothetical protein